MYFIAKYSNSDTNYLFISQTQFLCRVLYPKFVWERSLFQQVDRLYTPHLITQSPLCYYFIVSLNGDNKEYYYLPLNKITPRLFLLFPEVPIAGQRFARQIVCQPHAAITLIL